MIIRTNRAHLDPVVCHGIEAVVAYKQDLIRAENLRADAAKRPSWQERNLKRECITPEPLAVNFKTGAKNLMKNFNDKPQRPQPPQSKQSAERRNPPQFDNKPLVVKDCNIIVFFIYNLFFAPLAVPVFLYIGDIFPYYTPFVSVAFAVVSYLNSAHTRFVHLTDRSINYVNKGKITKSIKFDEISLIKLTATPLFGHIVPARNSEVLYFRSS